MTKDNLSCRPGTTDAMQSLADENERLKVEIGIVRGKNHCQSELLNQYTDENEALRAERDALEAKVDRLSKSIPCTVRQYRHNNDNSPNLFAPEHGFVIAYEREAVDRLLAETPAQSVAHIRAAGAREALERAMKPRGFSDTVVRVDFMREIIEQMEAGK